MTKLTPEQEMKRRTRRGFLTLGAAGVAGVAGFAWLRSGTPDGNMAPGLRRAMEFNESVTKNVLFSGGNLAREFPASRAEQIRANGDIGLSDDLDANWSMKVTPYKGGAGEFHLDHVRRLPKVEHTMEFKCIEGWSAIVHWGGARLSDFTARYASGSEAAQYVAMETPDGEYYVGIEMASALHPQTMLCYEMNGKPLEEKHGAPLRLVTPVKYGIKNIKRIGSIAYVDAQPKDYWANEGYDYYAGL